MGALWRRLRHVLCKGAGACDSLRDQGDRDPAGAILDSAMILEYHYQKSKASHTTDKYLLSSEQY